VHEFTVWLVGESAYGGLDTGSPGAEATPATNSATAGTIEVSAEGDDVVNSRVLPQLPLSPAKDVPAVPSVVDVATMSPQRRLQLWLLRPVLVRAVEVSHVCARGESHLKMFSTRPAWMLLLLRLCRMPWRETEAEPDTNHDDDDDGGDDDDDDDGRAAGGDGDSSPWYPSARMTALAMQQATARALDQLQVLAEVPHMRQTLLEMGALLVSLDTALGGACTLTALTDPSHPVQAQDVCELRQRGATVPRSGPRSGLDTTGRPLRDAQRPRGSFLGSSTSSPVGAASPTAAATATAHGDGDGDGDAAGGAPDEWVEQLAVRQGACRVLQILVGAADEVSRRSQRVNPASDLMRRIMRQLVTPGMLRRLNEGSFLTYVLPDALVEQPVVIWSPGMRARAAFFVESELLRVEGRIHEYSVRACVCVCGCV